MDGYRTIFWFRRDLRLEDNHGLFEALKSSASVQPVFIFDKHILEDLKNKSDQRVSFIYQAVVSLKLELEKLGSTLLIFHDYPENIFKTIVTKAVYTNHDYEPYASNRDDKIKKLLRERGIAFHTFKDQVIYEKLEVAKADGKPYTVFTPYSRKWTEKIGDDGINPFNVGLYTKNLKKTSPANAPTLREIGFDSSQVEAIDQREIPIEIIKTYNKTRNSPGLPNGTTKLSIHLRFGTISIRKLATLAMKNNETFLNELIWREFYMMILWNFPEVVAHSFKAQYDNIPWRNNDDEFEKWCNGITGFAMVDAGMRELNATGFMHNRARMVVASFLTKDLLIDWRWGEAYFAEKLLDYELASNNGGWQWAAGCGCDAAPYFRIFNPITQAAKFDPNNEYIKKWVPEYNHPAYKPMLDHKSARLRALETYKKALTQS